MNPDLLRGGASVIDQSHQRSRSFGIAVDDAPDCSGLAAGQLQGMLEESRLLFQQAAPVMETLYGQIANTHSMVLLTSAQGVVLHSLGDSDFLEKASRVALVPGMDWSEQTKGTNAIGTALIEQAPVTVLGDQHYMRVNQALTCSCAPIFDPHGQVVGALDVTGDHRSHHQHTLALVRMSAQMIENQMFAASFPDAMRLHFHARAEFLGTLVEGIAVFTPDGRFLSANRSAQFQLGLSFAALQAHTFSSLFGLPVSMLHEWFRTSTAPRQLGLHNGVAVWCRARLQPRTAWQVADVAQGIALQAPRRMQLSSLQYLDTGDPQLAAVIHKLRRVVDRDIPVMILGETGTGKDLLAQAIHHDSARARQPFVAVNCASIPESLIEAELFGYEEGAFTGARRKGATGKIVQAHGGTLFLDEIGDMPAHLQARLLRMLQERKVSPLGAAKEVVVDVNVISATHKNLKEMVARGTFREDLYYRLNGLVVRLPALRERTDLELVVKKLLKSLCDEARQGMLDLAPEVMALLRRHHWPGNVRQLHNLLRTAVAMADDGVITPAHLPDDFLDELRERGGPATGAPPLGTAEEAVSGSPRLQDVTLDAMARMLHQHQGNVSAAARALGISRTTIYRKRHLLPPGVLG